MAPLTLTLSGLDPKASSLLWGPVPFVECLAVLGSTLPHNTHVPPPDNGQGPASEADSPSGDWPSQWGLPRTTVESQPGLGGGKTATVSQQVPGL